MQVQVKKTSDRELEIEVQGEGHTLGNMLAKELQEMEEVELAYYEIPHPLQDRMLIYIRTREGADPLDTLRSALKRLDAQLEQLEGELERVLGAVEGEE